MIPPVSVTPDRIHYTADALRLRIGDLALVVTAIHVARAGLDRATWATGNPDRLMVAADLDRFAREVDAVRADLDGVLATLEPAEWERSINGGLASWISGMPALSWVAPGGWATGTSWAWLRPLTGAVEATAPWVGAASITPVMSRSASTDGVTAPTNLAERLERLPTGDSHIRIDRFETHAGPRFEVYLSGTDFSAGPDNPWWAGADLDLLVGGSSDSVLAVESAMRQAGVTADSPVVMTGHSQGGAIALALARTGNFHVDAIITAGTPVGLTGDAPGVPTLHIQHPEDPVPAFGGEIADAAGTTVLIHSEPRASGTNAHHASVYRASVERLELFDDPMVRTFENGLPATGRGIASWYVASVSR